MQQQITVKFVDGPSQNRRSGKVKDTMNVSYLVPPEHLGYFQKGGTYTVSYEMQGKWPMINGVNGHVFGPGSGPQTVQHPPPNPQWYPGPTQYPMHPPQGTAATGTQPVTLPQTDPNKEWQAREREKSMYMAVVGVLSRGAGNGLQAEQFDEYAQAAVKACQRAWAAADGYDLSKAPNDPPFEPARTENPGEGLDLNDEIGF